MCDPGTTCGSRELAAGSVLVIGADHRLAIGTNHPPAARRAAVEAGSEALVISVLHAAAGTVDEVEHATGALAVRILIRRKDRGLIPRVAARDGGGAGATTAALGRDEDYAVRRARAVEGCRIGTLEDRDVRDVFRIDIRDGATEVAAVGESIQVRAGAARVATAIRVRDRHAVDDVQWIVVAVDRGEAADADVHRTALGTVASDVHTGDLAREPVHDVRVVRGVELFARYL